LNSNTSIGVGWAKGISRTSSAALSVVPSRANRPPMMMMLVDEKKDGVVERF